MSHNAADKKQVQKKADEAKNDHDQVIVDIRAILEIPSGKRFFKHLMSIGNLVGTSMTGNSWTFFNEGTRNYSNIVWSTLLEASPQTASEIFLELTKESETK